MSIEVFNNHSLRELNTFQIDVKATYFVEIETVDDLVELFELPKYKNEKKFIIGGGSNVLFVNDFNGLIIKNGVKGREKISEDELSVVYKFGAGESWNEIVEFCVDQNLAGIENMAAIPGTIGAAAAQNIAAYGHNQEDLFVSLTAIEINSGKKVDFKKEDCKFNYRTSVFKKELKDQYVITSVIYRLNKLVNAETSYHETGLRKKTPIVEALQEIAQPPYSSRNIFDAVTKVREDRLPDYKKFPTCGCFFKNPVILKTRYKELLKTDPDLQAYPVDKLKYDDSFTDDEYVKIGLGRLVENLGWRGKTIGNVGIHEKHGLFVYTNGKASGQEVLEFTNKVAQDVYDNYGIKIESEVQIVG